MSFEDTLAAVVRSQLAPLTEEIRSLRSRVESVDRRLPPALVTQAEAARALKLSLSTVRRRVADGTLPSCRVGKSLRVDLGALNPITDEEVDEP